ncbi:hypothetical protein VVD49_05400 [Uliginosibacterium sp. H3]|uniref:Uncharacterized protein n=1 Tax=Uliginosibacterium silvisoli TaxID=3114758 RepID=A0ABU6K048_9RHOO|nr:hypothetical protein [Uliginosibacterium sp. H3]
MEAISILSLEKHDGEYKDWPKLTRLYCNGIDTGRKIPGYLIEAQYRCAEGYLLVTSQDCPFEESNDFLLLDAHFDLIATAGLLVPYASFLINEHWPLSDRSIRIHYYGDLFMDLAIEDPSEMSLPLRGPIARGAASLFASIRHGLLRLYWGENPGGRRSPIIKVLRTRRFDDFRDDAQSLASIQDLDERLEKIRQRSSDASTT